jgi:hypothetical protein
MPGGGCENEGERTIITGSSSFLLPPDLLPPEELDFIRIPSSNCGTFAFGDVTGELDGEL